MTDVLLIALIVLVSCDVVLHVSQWRSARRGAPGKRRSSPSLDAALQHAFRECGLNVDAYHDDFNLVRSGKLHEVVHHAAVKLGQDPVETVAHVKQLLSGRSDKV